MSWGEEGGTGGKRGCLVYNPEQKAALATNCASYVLYLNLNFLFLTETRIRFHSRGKKCGPEVLVPVVTCKKKKEEVRLLSVICRPQRTGSDTPLDLQICSSRSENYRGVNNTVYSKDLVDLLE